MKRISLSPLWYFVIICLMISLNTGTFAQQNTTAVPTKEKTTQSKPRLQVDTTKSKPAVKPTPGAQKDKIPTGQQTGKTQQEKEKATPKTYEDDQPTGTKESPKQKDAIDVKGEKTSPREDAIDVKGDKTSPQKEAVDVKGEKQGSAEPTHYEHRVEKDQQGHAYGKDKEDLGGKEFGQQRAEQARLNREVKGKELDETIHQGEVKAKEAREKIERAKEQLERDKKAGKISEQVYQERKEKISKAEQALSDLEYNIEKGKTVKPR